LVSLHTARSAVAAIPDPPLLFKWGDQTIVATTRWGKFSAESPLS